MEKTVYVVQYLELGWDNVIGVFDANEVSIEELQEVYSGKYYVITDRTLATSIE